MQPIINDTEIMAIYNKADDAGKATLKAAFGSKPFEINLRDTITSFEAGLKYKGLSSADVLPVVPHEMYPSVISQQGFAKLIFLAAIFLNGWTPELDNPNQKKWFPWFTSSGSGLSFDDAGYVSDAFVASRLYFPTEELARWFGKTFIKYYEEYYS